MSDPYTPDDSSISDHMGGRRVSGPADGRGGVFIQPGVPLKPSPDPRPLYERVGAVPVPITWDPNRPVEPSNLPFNPLTHAGVMPTRLNYDPRNPKTVGSGATVPLPLHVVQSRLSVSGVEDWMFEWVKQRGLNGQIVDDPKFLGTILNLARFGDARAQNFYNYIAQVAKSVRDWYERQRQIAIAKQGAIMKRPF